MGRRPVRRARDRPRDPDRARCPTAPDAPPTCPPAPARCAIGLLDAACRRDRRRPYRHRAPCRRPGRDADHAAQPRRRGRGAGRACARRSGRIDPAAARLAARRTGRARAPRRASRRSTTRATSATDSTARGCARRSPGSTGSTPTASPPAPRAGRCRRCDRLDGRSAGRAIVPSRHGRNRCSTCPATCRSNCAAGWSSAACASIDAMASLRGSALAAAVRTLESGRPAMLGEVLAQPVAHRRNRCAMALFVGSAAPIRLIDPKRVLFHCH